MRRFALATLLLSPAALADAALVRRTIAEVSAAQVAKIDPAWEPAQRDCAGLVRFAYRRAFQRAGRDTPLWTDDRGRPAAFADAETLLAHSFTLLGRDAAARRRLESGDLVAFRQGTGADAVFHLMLVLAPEDPAHARARVVYHPGEKDAAVRTGLLDELASQAPEAWRPVPENPGFLGFYRFKEWQP